jgi:hypothetical protein
MCPQIGIIGEFSIKAHFQAINSDKLDPGYLSRTTKIAVESLLQLEMD